MIGRSDLCVAAFFGLAALIGGWTSPAQAQQPECRFFKVQANGANIAKEPRGDSAFIDMVDKNEIVCVTRDQQAGERSWGYVAHKLEKPNQQVPVEGWAAMRSLQPATPAEIAAVRGAPAPAAPPPAAAAAPGEETVRFSEPITFGPYPVNGHSLEELINGTPLFPPIEGLDDSVWKKTCNNCHKWDRQTLCEQGAVYAKNPKAALRLTHPYGGADKVAMMKWARGGCQ